MIEFPIQFPPEFYGLVAALWNTYQYAILIWMGLMLGCVLVLALGVIVVNIARPFWST